MAFLAPIRRGRTNEANLYRLARVTRPVNAMLLQHTFFAGLYPFFAFTPLTIFLALFLFRFVKSRQKMFLHLTFLFVITIVNQGCLMLMVVANVAVVAQVFFVIAQVLEVTGMLIMVIVLEAFEENNHRGDDLVSAT
jgi:hypothetical protein